MPMASALRIGLMAGLLAALGCGPGDAPREAEPPLEEAVETPEPARELLGNPWVQLVRLDLPPGGTRPMELRPPRAMFTLSHCRILFSEEGKEPVVEEFPAGSALWHDAGIQGVENVGEAAASYLALQRLDAELPAWEGRDPRGDVMAVAPDLARLVFENDHIRIVEVTLPAGGELAPHDGLNRAVCSLSPYTVRFQAEGEEPLERSFEEGQCHWHEAGVHGLANIGDTEARFVIFSLKR